MSKIITRKQQIYIIKINSNFNIVNLSREDPNDASSRTLSYCKLSLQLDNYFKNDSYSICLHQGNTGSPC